MSERFSIDNSYEHGLNKHLSKCFGVVAGGLLVTAIVAFISYSTGLWRVMYTNTITFWLFFLLELGVVIFFSARLHKMSKATAYLCFFLYAAINGYTLGSIGVAYDVTTIGLAFGLTVVLFVNLCIIGLTTKVDVTKYSVLLFAGLIALVIASFVGLFMNLPVLDMIVCYVGIGLFLCLIAYDVQILRRNYELYQGDEASKALIYSAFELYLDFVNIFLYVLRILGKRD